MLATKMLGGIHANNNKKINLVSIIEPFEPFLYLETIFIPSFSYIYIYIFVKLGQYSFSCRKS